MSKWIPVIVAMAVVGGLFALVGNPFTSGNDVTPPPVQPPPTNGTPILTGDEPPEDRTWVSPGKVSVTIGLDAKYPVQASYPITVHNGNLTPTTFSVRFAEPHNASGGFSMPPDGAQDWVIIAESSPVLDPRETREITITLVVPSKKDNLPNWEFWIVVGETGHGGFVTTEMAIRWLVTTRSK